MICDSILLYFLMMDLDTCPNLITCVKEEKSKCIKTNYELHMREQRIKDIYKGYSMRNKRRGGTTNVLRQSKADCGVQETIKRFLVGFFRELSLCTSSSSIART